MGTRVLAHTVLRASPRRHTTEDDNALPELDGCFNDVDTTSEHKVA